MHQRKRQSSAPRRRWCRWRLFTACMYPKYSKMIIMAPSRKHSQSVPVDCCATVAVVASTTVGTTAAIAACKLMWEADDCCVDYARCDPSAWVISSSSSTKTTATAALLLGSLPPGPFLLVASLITSTSTSITSPALISIWSSSSSSSSSRCS